MTIKKISLIKITSFSETSMNERFVIFEKCLVIQFKREDSLTIKVQKQNNEGNKLKMLYDSPQKCCVKSSQFSIANNDNPSMCNKSQTNIYNSTYITSQTNILNNNTTNISSTSKSPTAVPATNSSTEHILYSPNNSCSFTHKKSTNSPVKNSPTKNNSPINTEISINSGSANGSETPTPTNVTSHTNAALDHNQEGYLLYQVSNIHSLLYFI